MPSSDRIRDKMLSMPDGTVHYFASVLSSGKPDERPVRKDALRLLFNYAGRPVPKELEQGDSPYTTRPRSEIAELVDIIAVKQGYSESYRAEVVNAVRTGSFAPLK